MSDTQWTVPDDGKNPGTVAVGIIDQINARFIDAGVKFVVQVGDLTDDSSEAAMDTRAAAARALYKARTRFRTCNLDSGMKPAPFQRSSSRNPGHIADYRLAAAPA